MTPCEIMKAAHAEARAIVAARRWSQGPISYREALMYGMRRVYHKIAQDRMVAAILAEPAKPKFMWLRGM